MLSVNPLKFLVRINSIIDAHRMLSYCYLKGRGVVINYEKIIELSKNIITLYGNEKKQPPPETLGHFFNNIGYSYEMLQNYTKALEFYFLALNNCSNYEFAGLNIGFCFEHGLGVEINQAVADQYYEKYKDSLEAWKIARNIK